MNHYDENDMMVTVVTLAFNHRNYIRQCIEGILMQKTSFRFELLIHDDASTDGTAQIIKEYETAYPDIVKPIYQTENQYSKGVRIGAKYLYPRAQGKYIAECEGDDYWTDPLKLQKQVDYLESNPECGLCYTDFDLYEQSSKQFTRAVFENKIYKRPTSFEEHLVECGYIAPMSWVFRKSVYDELEFLSFSDGTFALALEFFKQSKVFYLPEVTCVYRGHQGSASRPTDTLGFFKQYCGVFYTQLYFAEKYQVKESLVKQIKSGSYFKLLPSAIETEQEEFIEDAVSFFKENNFNYNELLKLCDAYLQVRRDVFKARDSHAYRVGRAVLRPFSLLKTILRSQ